MPWPDVDAIVIGTSAGGVDALLALVQALPAGMPQVVMLVLHRPARPLPRSSPAALLATRCALPVAEAWHGQPLRPGEVVVAPADYHLQVDVGAQGPVVSLSVDPPVLWSRPAIDPLFESAAAVWRHRLLGLVLTGASTDGTAGAAAVRRCGGEVWVQDPSEAVAPTMPASVIERVGADRVLTLAAMGRALGHGPSRSDA